MTRLQHRLSRLEQQFPNTNELPLVFVTFGGPGEPANSRWAIVPMVGGIWRRNDESLTEFERRAYALKAAGVPLEELSEAELAAAYIEADRFIAESSSLGSGLTNRQS